MTRKIEAGTVIAGTLRNEDLINAFLGEIESVMEGSIDVKVVRAYRDASVLLTHYEYPDGRYLTKALDRDGQIESELVNDLIDALNEYAPEDMYFGTQDGYVGSDFGWWYAQ
tara:strand:- start:69 stop:404 length:336 start_codon:yes stop_codon:yes gene_type:complete